jgi:putative mRNA 3-end processing factor
LQQRLGPQAVIQPVDYGQTLDFFGVRVSLHPAGHILGSAQVRVEHEGEVWVVSGDYKVAADPTCMPFEPLRCHTFITESTFGHPMFAWEPQANVFQQIHDWWRGNQGRGEASLIYVYSLGKAQRLLSGLDAGQGPIFVHSQIDGINRHYQTAGVNLPPARCLTADFPLEEWQRAVVLLPPCERWSPNFICRGPYRTAFASGWMTLPNGPQQRRVDKGFALSDHADHREILETVAATGAETVLVTHGYIDVLVDVLQTKGVAASPHRTPRCQKPPVIPARQRELEF